MKNNQPLVSVAMPAYNTEKHIAQAIESILNQSYTNFELLIQNDCSTDSTLEVITSFDDPRISVCSNDFNRGPGYTRNMLIDRAQGKYIMFSDSDDINEAHRLETQVDFMESHPDVSICGSYMLSVDEYDVPRKGTFRYPLTHEKIAAWLMFSSPIAHPTLFMRLADILDNSLKYTDKYSYAEDMVLWNRAIDKVRFANVPEKLVHYRVWSGQMSSTKLEQQTTDAVDINCQRLARLGVNLTDTERAIFTKMLCDYRNEGYTKKDIKIYRSILCRIWKGNKLCREFKPSQLRNVLTKRFRKVCKRAGMGKIAYHLKQVTLWLSLT